MNLVHMTELLWATPFALLPMLAVSVSLHATFKHRGWI
jgi:Mg2+ and Co2+ transporter CorA